MLAIKYINFLRCTHASDYKIFVKNMSNYKLSKAPWRSNQNRLSAAPSSGKGEHAGYHRSCSSHPWHYSIRGSKFCSFNIFIQCIDGVPYLLLDWGYREKKSPNFSCCALTTISWACHVPTPLLPSLSSMVNHYNQFLAHIFPLLSPTSSYLFIWQKTLSWLNLTLPAPTELNVAAENDILNSQPPDLKWTLEATQWSYYVSRVHLFPHLPPTTSYLLSAPSSTPSPVLSVGDLAS